MPSEAEKKAVKDKLTAANEEIKKAIKRVDTADDKELAELRGAAHTASAFVDFNSGCGKGRAE
jgi:hypothetical protein